MNVGDLVVTTKAVVKVGQVSCGRVLTPPESGDRGIWVRDVNRVWLDLNIMSNHLPQMYGVDELEPATVELAEQHNLCLFCLGYGLTLDPLAQCEHCKGSGRRDFQVKIEQLPEGGTRITLIPQED